jgi:Type II secretion system (T2SS), protein E, N-terminal domain
MSDAVMEHTNDSGIRTALGTLLIEAGHLDGQRLEEALRIGADTGERLGEVVVRMGWASEDDLAKALANQWHLRYVERSAISFDADALSRMSREEATRLEALPMQIGIDGAIIVALAEPTDARLLALRSLLGDRIDCVVVAKTAIDAGLRSELLAKNARTPEAAKVEEAEVAEVVDAQHETGLSLVSREVTEVDNGTVSVIDEPVGVTFDTVVVADEHSSTDFDELAKSLSDGLSAQLGSLRAIVVEAESARQHDGIELARLTAELAGVTADLAARTTELSERTNELSNRNETIVSMLQKLRELADTLEQSS